MSETPDRYDDSALPPGARHVLKDARALLVAHEEGREALGRLLGAETEGFMTFYPHAFEYAMETVKGLRDVADFLLENRA
jgi:hypothetical protein